MYSKQQIENIKRAQHHLQQKSAHLLNGQMMYEHFKKHDLMRNEGYAPFNEAMCFKEVDPQIFSDDFVIKRCEAHHVSVEDYLTLTLKPLTELLNSKFETLVLWFGTDMFCQINLLTVLAYLEQVGFEKEVILHVFDEDTFEIKRYDAALHSFHDLYQTVLVQKKQYDGLIFDELASGVKRYLDYHAEANELTTFIKDHILLSAVELLNLLFKTFPQYGLGDTQYLDLIEHVKKSHC